MVVLDGDLGNSTKAETVRMAFPERFFNLGIAESNLVGVGAGLAACGFIPWITSFSSFLLCNAYDQIRLQGNKLMTLSLPMSGFLSLKRVLREKANQRENTDFSAFISSLTLLKKRYGLSVFQAPL